MTSGPVMGDCRLCGMSGVPLRDSHIMPKWAYRRTRDPTAVGGSPNPIRVQDGVAVQTSAQITEYMLCGDCEQLFSTDENYVSKLAVQDSGAIGLADLLLPGSVQPTGMQAFGARTRAAPVSHLDCQSIARFAASVFWRGAVSLRHRLNELHLWKSQVEALRQFALRKRRLPDRMCLNLIVPVDGENDLSSVYTRALTTPATAKRGDNSMHQFMVAGLMFNLSTGTESAPFVCLECGSSPHAMIQHWKAIPHLFNAARMFVGAMPKGKGALRALPPDGIQLQRNEAPTTVDPIDDGDA